MKSSAQGIAPMADVVGAGLVSVGVVYGLGFATKALVPLTMTKFGIVMAGIGTLHAAHAAGGLAANLQAFAHVVLQKKVVLKVFVAGQKERLPNFKNLI